MVEEPHNGSGHAGKPGMKPARSGQASSLFVRVAASALKRCAAEFVQSAWMMEAWRMRALENASWQEIERRFKRKDIHVGWRRIRRAVHDVAEALRTELIAESQAGEAGEEPVKIIGPEPLSLRQGQFIHIHLPVGSPVDKDLHIYAYLLVVKLVGGQRFEHIGEVKKEDETVITYKIVDCT